MEAMKETLKVGDVCPDCEQEGLLNYLRYFKINLKGGTLLKCESDMCMYPYNNDLCSSDEEQEDAERLTETNSINFIDDFIQQFRNEQEQLNNTNDLKIHTGNSEQQTTEEFDLSFLDNLNISMDNNTPNEDSTENIKVIGQNTNFNLNENPLTTFPITIEYPKLNEFSTENTTFLDNQNNAQINNKQFVTLPNCIENENLNAEFSIEYIENQFTALPNVNTPKCEITTAEVQKCPNQRNDNEALTDNTANDFKSRGDVDSAVLKANCNQPNNHPLSLNIDSVKDCKPKIDIQSIETIKMTPSTINILPTSSTNTSTVTSSTPLPADCNTTSSDIPKAHIVRGSELLKILALADEKFPKVNTKVKGARKKYKKKANNPQITKEEPEPYFLNTDTGFSLDKLSEIINAKQIKRKSKK